MSCGHSSATSRDRRSLPAGTPGHTTCARRFRTSFKNRIETTEHVPPVLQLGHLLRIKRHHSNEKAFGKASVPASTRAHPAWRWHAAAPAPAGPGGHSPSHTQVKPTSGWVCPPHPVTTQPGVPETGKKYSSEAKSFPDIKPIPFLARLQGTELLSSAYERKDNMEQLEQTSSENNAQAPRHNPWMLENQEESMDLVSHWQPLANSHDGAHLETPPPIPEGHCSYGTRAVTAGTSTWN